MRQFSNGKKQYSNGAIWQLSCYSERPNKIVIARSEALHGMVFRAKRRGNLTRLFYLVRNDIQFKWKIQAAILLISVKSLGISSQS